METDQVERELGSSRVSGETQDQPSLFLDLRRLATAGGSRLRCRRQREAPRLTSVRTRDRATGVPRARLGREEP
jgi:hypothetical protein